MKVRVIMLSVVLSMAVAACGQSVVSGDDASSGSVDADAPTTTAAAESSSSIAPSSGTVVPAAGASTTETTQPPEPAPVPEEDTKPVPVTTVPGEGDVMPVPPEVAQSPLVGSAVNDLSDRLGVSAASITVVLVEEVTWPDGSLGCPQPGMSYTQALIDGSRIVLEVGGTSYEYHSGGGRGPFYCPSPAPRVPSEK